MMRQKLSPSTNQARTVIHMVKIEKMCMPHSTQAQCSCCHQYQGKI
ncbi:hypothetical protein SBW85_17470 [Vibrio plantisponsor]|uniref:Uncharacterized protein n=1 Tax=Vibrio plantisponsor TaxID=664643 RepID=A0ABU4ILQ6_9VIBR|nr:hypothetical protein [Vibrio plantisponsor]MDW6019490.1 hypothetical protein [Vibrio plantisponsor]NNM39181.1 hypothetical protein [Vibrio plantisponsor]